jgi:hypothetical protein
MRQWLRGTEKFVIGRSGYAEAQGGLPSLDKEEALSLIACADVLFRPSLQPTARCHLTPPAVVFL